MAIQPTRLLRGALIGAGGAAVLFVAPSIAGAHIDPVPGEVLAGEAVTVSFTIEHGCDGLDTTGLLMQIPPGIADLEPVPLDGWTTSTEGDVVTFTGQLDADTEGTFSLSFTAPVTPGPVDFPFVQQCGDAELRWIEIHDEGAEEPEFPAPRLIVLESAAVATTASAETTGAPETTAVADTTAAAEDTTTAPAVIAPAPTDVADATADSSTDGAGEGDDAGGSSAGWIVLAVAAMAAAGAAFVVMRRRRGAPVA